MIGSVGHRHSLVRAGEESKDVDGHVACPHHGGVFDLQVWIELSIFGVTVIPAHKTGGRVAVLGIFEGDAKFAVILATDGESNPVVMSEEIVGGDVPLASILR